MFGFDGNQFLQAIKESDVSGSYGAAGHQVIKNTTDVDHHIAGGFFLTSVDRELGHQKVHHLGSWISQQL